MRRFVLLGLTSLFISTTLFSQSFEGKGLGENETRAREAALADLASFLSVRVTSEMASITSSDGAKSALQIMRASTDLPLGGARVSVTPTAGGYEATARLESAVSTPFYLEKLRALESEIATLNSAALKQKGETREKTLRRMMALVGDAQKYREVAKLLAIPNLPPETLSQSELLAAFAALEKNVETLEMAARLAADNLKAPGARIYLLPPRAEGSSIPTALSLALKDRLAVALGASTDPAQSTAHLSGLYRITPEGIDLTLYLVDNASAQTLATYGVKLLPAAYRGYAYQLVEGTFEKLLREGVVQGAGIKVALATNKGDLDLSFKGGEEIELLVKLNKAGFFYIIGHTKNNNGTMNYLLPLADGAVGKARFIRYVGPEEANRWISLGAFTVEEPYGLESLQVIASNKTFETLPQTRSLNGYDLIAADMPLSTSLLKVRALRPKPDTTREVSESVLTYVTTAH